MRPNPEITAKYEEERLRAQDQSQIVYLQGQLDELRRLIKDQTNKYNWAIEQVRKTEALVGQFQGMFERHTEDIRQTVEVSRRDIASLRKDIASALVKIEEGVQPIREMQSQIHQLAEARKHDRDSVFPIFARIEEAERKMTTLQAQIKEQDERSRQAILQIERLREADAVVAQEARRISEELQVEKQSLRRQAVEAQQLVTDLRSVLDDHSARITRIDEIRQHIDSLAETLPSQIQDVAAQIPDIVVDVKRVERISTERFLMTQERLEDLRHQNEEKISTLQETDEQHLRHITSWLERIDVWVRELEKRLSRSTTRIETVQQEHLTHLAEIEKREFRVLEGLAEAFRIQFELTKAEQSQLTADSDKES
jgi:chromosome segregation ATPase